MKMTRDEFVEQTKLTRPYWTSEEFIATRILKEINASGAKAYEHLKSAVKQIIPECPVYSRWDVAAYLLKRRIALNMVVNDPKLIGLPCQALPSRKSGHYNLAGYIRDSAFHIQGQSSVGPEFYVARMPEDECLIGYAVWNLDVLRDISPKFTADVGRHQERIVTQRLKTFLDHVEFQGIVNELVL